MQAAQQSPTLTPSRFVAALEHGAPIGSVLADLVRAVEMATPGTAMLGSLLLLEGKTLRHGAAPSLPAAYNTAIDGVEIGQSVGSCGTAAYCGHPIYVTDIASDPLWKDFKALALEHNLRACWSTPIVGGNGRVLGTFALYYGQPRSPTAAERQLIDDAVAAARVVLDRHGTAAIATAGPAPSRG